MSAAFDLTRYVHDLMSAPDRATTADEIVQATAHATGSHDIGITLLAAGGRLTSVAPTTDDVIKADELQYTHTEGPCVQAALEQLTTWSGDLRTETRWPHWSPGAATLGFRSVLSVQLRAAGRRVGGLNIYGRQTAQFDAETADLVVELAQFAAMALSRAGQIENLNVAMSTRNMIGQAQGILMERFGVDAERAFAVLQRHSQDQNIKLREVAETLIVTSQLPSPAPPPE